MNGLRFILLPLCVFLLFACATTPSTYEDAISQWKSYKDVAKWMSWHFSYDMQRYNETVGKGPLRFPPRKPQETFRLRSGVCYDAAVFAKATLNRIDSSYVAKIVVIEDPSDSYVFQHFVCSFKKDGKLFIMDYGTPHRNMVGIHGPYNSLDEYTKFFERNHPIVNHVNSIYYWTLY